MSSTVQKLPARGLDLGTGAPELPLSERAATPECDFRGVYESRFHEVMRWIPPLDVSGAEISEAVEIFGETLAGLPRD